MWLGSLAIAGVPFFAGYWSKDAILEATYASHNALGGYGFVLGVLAAFLTAFYSWRLIIMTFHGTTRASKHTMEHVHESTRWMTVPLMILAVGAVFAGYALHDWFIGEDQLAFWAGALHAGPTNHVLVDMEHVPLFISLLPTITGVLGIALAYLMYMLVPSLPGQLATAFQPVYQFLLHKWYFDELYDFLFVRPAQRLARLLWHVGDEKLIDGMPNGVAALAAEGSMQVVKIQTGSIAVYAFTMLIGLVLLITIFLLFR
jgi:NADH-quinone oxidoreductase subunit L